MLSTCVITHVITHDITHVITHVNYTFAILTSDSVSAPQKNPIGRLMFNLQKI